jgi:5'-methylthioadenosine phosphorylase
VSDRASIGIFGGSGFYAFASESDIEEVTIETPYGPPSDLISLCRVGDRTIAFLPRHGRGHTIPPHKINYRANVWALHSLGVRQIIAPNAVGSLTADYKPGDFAINDQFVDRTTGRADTFYDGPRVTHVSTAEPYCSQLRTLAIESTRAVSVRVHETGTCVIIQGPRFSTKAESRWFSDAGWHIINMTQYPEVALARELAMCYVNISLVTDYDAGVAVEGSGHVEASDVLAILAQNSANVKRVIRRMIENWPDDRACTCGNALDFAVMG